MAGRWKMYDAAKHLIDAGGLDLSATTGWRVALFGVASNANSLGTLATFADLTDELPTANGYTQGGVGVTDQTLTMDAGVDTFDSADAAWVASGGDLSAAYAVYFRQGTYGAVTDPLLCVSVLNDGAVATAADTASVPGVGMGWIPPWVGAVENQPPLEVSS